MNAWMVLTRRNKKLHQDSSANYKKEVEASMMAALVLGASTGLLNVVLGAFDPTTILINVAQIVPRMTDELSATIIVQVAKQLDLDANNLHHNETALKYGELYIMIRSEMVLLRRNESSYSSAEDFSRQCQNERNRIEESAQCVPEHVGIKCICSSLRSPEAGSPRVLRHEPFQTEAV